MSCVIEKHVSRDRYQDAFPIEICLPTSSAAIAYELWLAHSLID